VLRRVGVEVDGEPLLPFVSAIANKSLSFEHTR
jgi:hypothetical protein